MTPKNRQVNSGYQPLVFVCGDDDFEVNLRCRRLLDRWKNEYPNAEFEIVDGQASKVQEVLDRISALKEALETYPLFGSGKAIWFRHCNFLGEDGHLENSNPVGNALEGLLAILKKCDWKTTKLLISATSVDKKRSLYKWLKQAGKVIFCKSLAIQGKTKQREEVAESKALELIESEVRRSSKVIRREVAQRMVELVGLDRGTLVSECEKAILHSGDSNEVDLSDVEATVSPTRQAEAFAFADAVAKRNLEESLARLEDEIWSMKTDSQKSELGLLHGLVSKFRTLLLVKDAMEGGGLRPVRYYPQFKPQIISLDKSMFPEDRRFNLLDQHPYVIFLAMPLVEQYQEHELVRILEVLLEANQQMVFASVNSISVLRECVIKIVLGEGATAGGGSIRG